jgi:hypothetical protein
MSSGVPVGMYRTYVQLGPGEPFSFRRWSAGIRAGRTFITSGPILRMTVDGCPIGSTLTVPRGTVVEVRCEASSTLPIQSLQLVERGRVVDAVEVSKPERTLSLVSRVTITEPTWLAARCGGPGYAPLRHFDEQRRGIMAHTSPIYFSVGSGYRLRDPAVSEYMLTLIGAAREYLHASAQYAAGSTTHRHGRSDHVAYLDEPFRQAEDRIRARRRSHRRRE